MEHLATEFAPAEREAPDEVFARRQKLAANPLVGALLDSFPEPAVILNQQRQIIFANDKLAGLLGKRQEALIGLRHGEAFECIHARKRPGGCGTTRFCRHCGAARSILNSQQTTQPDVQECRIQRRVDDETTALDLRVWTTPVAVDGEPLMVFAIHDTTDEKRRQVLERLFFHDALNAVAGLSAILEMQPAPDSDESPELGRMAREYAQDLGEAIQSQRDLAAAERGDLLVHPETIRAADIITRLRMIYSCHSIAEGKQIIVSSEATQDTVRSDKTLLIRVLSNLIVNALEASAPGQTVTVCFRDNNGPTFTVHNQSVMPDEIQEQMFQRSFSTKGGRGRGIGTYSVKLLVEHYLGGKVTFSSTPAEGTTFTVRLPQSLAGV
ncbi:MAG: PAS domain-containing sensor histidine kinase [Deltaproteobacteria bacterium]|nr:PAS domain-containing sensor histidine kinase [Deltaproteobacteria bacterium]